MKNLLIHSCLGIATFCSSTVAQTNTMEAPTPATTAAASAQELASKQELYSGKEFANAFANPEDNPDLPNVLLIGDSISIGYTVDVRKRLAGKADVFRIPTNGKNASHGTEKLDEWLGQRKWDVIHFNWGLWDICYRSPMSKMQGHRDKVNGSLAASPQKYRESLEKAVARLKETDARLIWCSTTPVPKFEAGRKMGDEVKYNLIAESIMEKNEIPIDDLHAHALTRLPKIWQRKGDVHFTTQGYTYLAEKVALEIASVLTQGTNGGAQGSPKFDDLKLNQIQVIGSHNSFKAAIDSKLFELMMAVVPKAVEFDYAHPPLTDQLNLGLRNLELDVFHDPAGGRYAKPLGIILSGETARPYDPEGKMLEPGFKVLHVQDIDFRSNCLTLSDALQEIRTWSNKNPRHLPILITFNVSDQEISLPGSVKPLPFDRAALDMLDVALRKGLGEEQIVMPAEVQGEHETLESAVLAGAWPTLREARGRFLLVLDDAGRKRDAYLEGHPGLKGRAMFVNSVPGKPEAAIMIRNGPSHKQDQIKALVRKGYFVRTRADGGTHEAKRGDYSRFHAAQSSGAQVISTDYYLADWRLNPGYRVRFEKGSCCRLNPITAADLAEKAQAVALE